MRIPFKEIKPLYRSREYRERYQQLQEAMSNASSSIAILTSFAAKILSKKEDVDGVTEELNTICDRKELKIDQRAMLSFSLLLFVCKMVSLYMYIYTTVGYFHTSVPNFNNMRKLNRHMCFLLLPPINCLVASPSF